MQLEKIRVILLLHFIRKLYFQFQYNTTIKIFQLPNILGKHPIPSHGFSRHQRVQLFWINDG